MLPLTRQRTVMIARIASDSMARRFSPRLRSGLCDALRMNHHIEIRAIMIRMVPKSLRQRGFQQTAVNVRNLVMAQRWKNNKSTSREPSEACPWSFLEFLECVLPESNSTGQALNFTRLFSAQHEIPNEATELCECEQEKAPRMRSLCRSPRPTRLAE